MTVVKMVVKISIGPTLKGEGTDRMNEYRLIVLRFDYLSGRKPES